MSDVRKFSGCSPKTSNVSKLLSSLTKNERMSESLLFLNESFIRSLFAHLFAQKTNEQIPNPDGREGMGGEGWKGRKRGEGWKEWKEWKEWNGRKRIEGKVWAEKDGSEGMGGEG